MTTDPIEDLPGPGAAVLKQLLSRRPQPRPGSVCDMCREEIHATHSHVVNIENRALMCTCRACWLLFTADGAGGGSYRCVPDRYSFDPDFNLPAEQWERLQIPVGMAFFFHNSSMGETVALYPSPGGATESTLPLDAWDEIVALNPMLAAITDDVEAALFRKAEDGFECFVVPIDACYELVGRVRRSWKGFDGGQEMRSELDDFFTQVRARSKRRA
jgi:hypothetical protein